MPYANKEERKLKQKEYKQKKRQLKIDEQNEGRQTNSKLTNEIVVELIVENKIQQEVLPKINNNIQNEGRQINSKPKWILSPYENMKPFVCRIPDDHGNISDKSQTIILQTIIVHKPTATHPDTFQNK